MTFGRRNRRSSASLQASTPTATGAATTDGGDGGSGDTSGKGPPSSSLPSVTVHGRGSRLFESSSLAVVAAGAGAGTTSRRASAGAPSSAAAARQATTISPGHGERQKQRHLVGGALSSRRAAGRCEYNPRRSGDDYHSSRGSNTASASPELLYASGRITAARYHEMLQEMDRSGSRPALAGGPGAGTSMPHGATATVTSRGVGDTRRRSHHEQKGT